MEAGGLESALRRELSGAKPDHPIFIPAKTYSKSNRTVTVHLMEGYVFVASGLPETSYFKLEQKSKLISSVMSTTTESGIRVLSTIKDSEIEEMKRSLRERVSSDIEMGTPVRVLEGVYSGLEGEVIFRHGEHVGIYVEMRSVQVIVTVPMVSLETIDVALDKPEPKTKSTYQPRSKSTWEESLPDMYVDHLLGGMSELGVTLLARLFMARRAHLSINEQIESEIDHTALTSDSSGDLAWEATITPSTLRK